MAATEVVTAFAVPPARVWEVLADPQRTVQWRQQVRSARLVDGEPGCVGARYDLGCSAEEIAYEFTLSMVLTEIDPPTLVAYEMQHELTTVRVTYALAEVPDGTELRSAVEVDAPGPLARVTLKSVVARFTEDLERLASQLAG